MPKIQVTEQQVKFSPAMQPTSSGDGYSAPGRAVQQLGNALGNLGDAFSAKINEEDEYQDKLSLMKFQNEWEQKQIRNQNEFNRDDPNGYATEQYGQYQQSRDQFIPTLRSPKMQKQARLLLENHGSNVYERDMRFEYGKRDEKIFNDTTLAITNNFNGAHLNDPATVDQEVVKSLAGIDAMIKAAPISAAKKDALGREAVGVAIAKLKEVYGKKNEAGNDNMELFYPAMQRMLTARGIDPNAQPKPQSQGAPVSVIEGRVPTAAERVQIFRQGGVVVNLDSNWSPRKDSQTGPLVVIPDGATKEQRDAAQAYANAVAAAYKEKFGTSLPAKVLTRSENGRGRAATIHTEPFAVTDTKAVDYFIHDATGRAKLAEITRSTLGRIPGVQFSLPHDSAKGDRGAHGPRGNEVELAQLLLADLKRGGVATVPGLKEGPAAVGRPASAGSKPERVSLAGLDDAGKAAKLEELVKSGYQSVVHQLDKDGNDVLLVRKSSVAGWFKNMSGGRTDDKGELANEQFAGPTWAHEPIKRMRSGELRGENKIPVDDGVKPVRVADASGGVPQTVLQPGATREFVEYVQKHMPQFAREHEAAQEKWAKGVEGRVKTIMDNADKGIIRDEDLALIDQMVKSKPEVAKRYGLDRAAESVAATTEDAFRMRQLPPTQLAEEIRQVDATIKGAKGVPPEVIASALKRKERMESLLKNMQSEVENDPLSWSQKVGIVQLQPLNPGDPNSLKDRVAAAYTVAQHFKTTPKFFTKAEREALGQQLKQGGKTMLGMLGALHQELGPDMLPAMSEISKHAPEAATIGWMMNSGHEIRTIEDAAIGIERQQKRALGEKMIVPPKVEEARQALMDTVGTSFTRMPGSEAAVTETAQAIYEARAQRAGWTKPMPDEYRKIIKEVVGETTDAQGNVFGGIHYQSGFLGMGKANPIVVPTNIRQDKFSQILDAIYSADELAAKGAVVDPTTMEQRDGSALPRDLIGPMGNGPMSASGTPLSIGALRKATLVTIGDGRYFMAMGDPQSDPKFVQDGTGKNFVLDLKALEPILKQRRPDLFKGYVSPVQNEF